MIVEENDHRSGITLLWIPTISINVQRCYVIRIVSKYHGHLLRNSVLMSDWPTGAFSIVFINVEVGDVIQVLAAVEVYI